MRHLPALVLALSVLAAAGCGNGGDPAELTTEGNRALGAGDHDAAREHFEEALEAIGGDTSHPEYLSAKLGAIEARTKGAPEEAVQMFLQLARSAPSRIDDRDYNRIGGRLGDAGNFEEAIELVKAGQAAHPESPHLEKLVQRLGDQASSAGASDALNALRGLGYVGD